MQHVRERVYHFLGVDFNRYLLWLSARSQRVRGKNEKWDWALILHAGPLNKCNNIFFFFEVLQATSREQNGLMPNMKWQIFYVLAAVI